VALRQLAADALQSLGNPFLRGDEVLGRIYDVELHVPQVLSGQRMDLADPLDFIPEKLHPQGVGGVGGKDLQDIPPHPKTAPFQNRVVAFV